MIYRTNIPVEDYQELQMGAVLSAAPCRTGRSDVIDIWHEDGETHPIAIHIFGTGHPTPWDRYTRYAYRFIDTVVAPNGLVWHVFVGPRHDQAIPV